MDATLLLFYLSALAGLILTVGSLFLLWKRTIVLDAKGDVSEVKLPFGINLKTQFPVLIMFFLGAFLLYVPQHYKANACKSLKDHEPRPSVPLVGEVDSGEDLDVYAIVDAQRANSDTKVELSVPCLTDRRFHVLYLNNKIGFRKERSFKLAKCDEPYQLEKVVPPQEALAGNGSDNPGAFDLTPTQTVAASVESNYK